MMPIQFITGGYNKSGTTFLQTILDSHPKISCAPEHHLKKLTTRLRGLIDDYYATIKMFDERTAKQGVRLNKNRLYREILTAAIRGVFNGEKDSTMAACGISDNWAYEIYPITRKLLPDLRYIYIVRDPREIAVSLYYHIKRTEPTRILSLTADDYAKNFGHKWTDHIKKIYRQKNENAETVTILKYENLVSSERELEIEKALTLLKVGHERNKIRDIFRKLDESLEQNKNKNKFYRSAKRKTWDKELKKETIKNIEQHASIGMSLAGYK
jgi:hypothetical protein